MSINLLITKKHILFVGVVCIVFNSGLLSAQQGDLKNKIKAAYLYNFTKFIVWPNFQDEVFNICLLGKDPFGPVINPIENRIANNRPIRLHRVERNQAIDFCQILYLGDSKVWQNYAADNYSEILTISSLAENDIQVVKREQQQQAVMIAFFIQDGKVRLRINVEKLRSSGLEVSAKLLEIAEVFVGDIHD